MPTSWVVVAVQVVADRPQAGDLVEAQRGDGAGRVAVDLLAAAELVVEVGDQRGRGAVLRDEQEAVVRAVGVLEELPVRVRDAGAVTVGVVVGGDRPSRAVHVGGRGPQPPEPVVLLGDARAGDGTEPGERLQALHVVAVPHGVARHPGRRCGHHFAAYAVQRVEAVGEGLANQVIDGPHER